jgi:hypothetical protein
MLPAWPRPRLCLIAAGAKPKQSHEAEISHRYVIEIPALSMSSAEWEASPRGDPVQVRLVPSSFGLPHLGCDNLSPSSE